MQGRGDWGDDAFSGEEKRGIGRLTWRKQERKGTSTSDLASSSSTVACESISSTLGMFQGGKRGGRGITGGLREELRCLGAKEGVRTVKFSGRVSNLLLMSCNSLHTRVLALYCP
jgi:hypothetical protein